MEGLMQRPPKNHKQFGLKLYLTPSISCLVMLVAILISLTPALHAQTNPGAMMGGGNFDGGDGETGTAQQQYDALNYLGARMSRLNIYPDRYWSGSAATPTLLQNAVLEAHANNNTPMILFEYYTEWGPLGDYNKWFAIGREFATQFRPNSPWLVSQGVTGWGISVYSAINEPDNAQDIPFATYVDALRGLADGARSVDASLKVIPGGFMSINAFRSDTLQGYGPAIAPLLNNGTLDGIDLHTYNDISFAPIVDSNGNATFDWSPQADFDSVKGGSGITRDINFYSTEFNFKNGTQGINEDLAAKRFLTCIWANLGVVKNDGHTTASQFAFPWNIFHTLTQDSLYGLSTQLVPYTPSVRGTTLKLVLDKTAGMSFVSRDPKGRGEFILNGNNKKMWVWQNYANWSNVAGTSYTVSGIPAGATSLEVYGYNGLRSTIPLSGQTSFTVTGLLTKETYMFLANAADGGGPPQADLIVTAISWSPTSPVTGNAVTFSATIKNQGTAATPAGVIHGVSFSVDGTQMNWSDTNTNSLAAGASITLTANNGIGGSSTWTATSGSHTILANVDDVNRIAESNESNNTLTAPLTVGAGQPDLIVTAISWSPASPLTGNAVTFSATIKNQGTAATPGGVIHGVEFKVDGVQVNWSDTSTASLAAGATRTLTANNGPTGSSTWTATSGSHTVLATVDDVNRIAESNENNNTLTAPLTVGAGQPDLIVTAVSWSPASPLTGNAVTFTATIKNQGAAASPAGVVHRVGFSVDGTLVNWSNTSTTSLAAGATRVLTANSGPSGSSTWTATTGTHTILAKVDDTSLIAESNETNNTLTSSMTVGTGQPDLIVTAITWSPAAPVRGQAVTFSATIKNQGTAATPSGVIHGVGFSVDGAEVTWSDLFTSALAPGASVTVTANGGPNGSGTWISTSGTHTILAFVDDVNRIAESNENNNTLTKSMTVKNH
jgi:subtilase family serine protease